MSATKVNSRSFTPNGPKIKACRVSKGWTVEDLSRKAILSTKTIESLEASRPVYLCTLRKCATALGLETNELLEELSNDPDPPPANSNVVPVHVHIHLSVDLSEFDESDQFTALLKHVIAVIVAKSPVNVKDINTGSTNIILEMTGEDAASLLIAFTQNRLPAIVQKVSLYAGSIPHSPPVVDLTIKADTPSGLLGGIAKSLDDFPLNIAPLRGIDFTIDELPANWTAVQVLRLILSYGVNEITVSSLNPLKITLPTKYQSKDSAAALRAKISEALQHDPPSELTMP